MNGSNRLLQIAAGIVAVAIALRLTVELIAPVAGFLVAAIVGIGVIVAVRWWRDNRW